MSEIIWLHEKALSASHPVFAAAVEGVKAVHIWDDAYYQRRGYSLKRLIFIYETLCDLPVDIIRGDTLEVLQSLQPSKVLIPCSADTEIAALTENISAEFSAEVVHEKPFCDVPADTEFTRFFKYWNKAKKMAFLAAK